MFIIKIGENWIQEQSNVFLWDILQLKRDISVTIYYPILFYVIYLFIFVSTDVTFNESESYFSSPHL